MGRFPTASSFASRSWSIVSSLPCSLTTLIVGTAAMTLHSAAFFTVRRILRKLPHRCVILLIDFGVVQRFKIWNTRTRLSNFASCRELRDKFAKRVAFMGCSPF